MNRGILLWSVYFFVLFNSCGDSTPVGSDLLGEDDLSLDFTNNIALTAENVEAQPVITFTEINFFNTSFLLGELDDPVFGKSRSSLFFEARPLINFPPDYERAELDSLVLMLEFSESGYYGDESIPHDLEVFRVIERMNISDTLFSNQSFPYDTSPLGQKLNYIPGRLDSLVVFDPTIDTTRILTGVLRIPLNNEFGEEIMTSIRAHEEVDDFLDLFNGLYLKSTVEGSSVMSLDMSTNSLDANMQLYYSIGPDTMDVYNYPLNATRSIRTSFFEHDLTGTDIETSIGQPVENDDPMYMQGMQGVNVKMDLGDVRQLNDIFINHVELELFIAQELLGDTSVFSPAITLGVLREAENGLLVVVDDLFTGIINNGIESFYGGGIETDENLSVQKYVINITDHVKQIYNNETSSEIFITVFDKAQHAERIIVYGPEHSQFPARLCVTYTNP